jgi:hypothetical protein
MGVRILEGKEGAVFYCSTTGWAFGPLMASREEAEAFLKWLKLTPLRVPGWRHDPRQLTDSGLRRAYARSYLERDEKRAKYEAAKKNLEARLTEAWEKFERIR